MSGTGIRQLTIAAGVALMLAGCGAAGKGGKTGASDAAAALGTESIATSSLDAAPEAAGQAAGGTAALSPDTTGGAGPAADLAVSETGVAVEPVPKARKGLFGFLKARPKAPADGTTTVTPATQRSSVRMVDRDVEAPDVFSVTEPGLWDGRPSLGGVWVAYADVQDPERVIIRNADTGAFVIGALFRRERENPGPKLQVSSDAATALGMLAGAPAKLNVTALRREEVVDPADAEALLGTDSPIEAQAIGPVATDAVAAIAATEPAKAASPPAPRTGLAADAPIAAAVAAPVPKAPPRSGGGKNFLQIGIFSVETNASNTATSMKTAGLSAQVVKEQSQGKTFWRVIVGPAGSAGERDALKAKATGLGFADAYFVTG